MPLRPPESSVPDSAVTLTLTSAALLAFAANSILCRLALGSGVIDAYSFTGIRLASGALVLGCVGVLRRDVERRPASGWVGTWCLLFYALPFSLAYVRVETGTGALLLFGAVQLTMIGHGLRSGERPRPAEWFGTFGAVAGLAYLVSPGLAAPDPAGAVFMVAAGVGWGAYSIVGRTSTDPAIATSENFRRASLCVVPVIALAWPWLQLSVTGVLLAAISGGLASGLGYVVWYLAVKRLSLTRAALVQLAVPVVAAAGGTVFAGERVSLRLVLAGAIVLGSIAVGIRGRSKNDSISKRTIVPHSQTKP